MAARVADADMRKLLINMEDSEIGWVLVKDAIHLDPDGQCFINPDATVYPQESHFHVMLPVERMGEGFILYLHRKEYCLWQQKDNHPESYMGVLEVVRGKPTKKKPRKGMLASITKLFSRKKKAFQCPRCKIALDSEAYFCDQCRYQLKAVTDTTTLL